MTTKRIVPSMLTISAPHPAVVDFVLPTCQVTLDVQCVEAGEAVKVAMRWDHIDHALRLDDRIDARSTDSPLVCVDPVPLGTSS